MSKVGMLANEKKSNEARAVSIATDAKIEKSFRSHQAIPNGRTFLFNRERDPEATAKYRGNFDNIFKSSPGYGF